MVTRMWCNSSYALINPKVGFGVERPWRCQTFHAWLVRFRWTIAPSQRGIFISALQKPSWRGATDSEESGFQVTLPALNGGFWNIDTDGVVVLHFQIRHAVNCLV